MGDPMYHTGLPYNVGTCKAGGVRNPNQGQVKLLTRKQFDARPAGFSCPSAAKIQSYCDAADPYCCNGSDAATHSGYGAEYGTAAYNFVKSKLGQGSVDIKDKGLKEWNAKNAGEEFARNVKDQCLDDHH